MLEAEAAEGLGEGVGDVVLCRDVMWDDETFGNIVVHIVVAYVYECSEFGGGRVLGDFNCPIIVNLERVGTAGDVDRDRRWRSVSKRRSQFVCCVAEEAARYSASQVERSTVFCLLEQQLMGGFRKCVLCRRMICGQVCSRNRRRRNCEVCDRCRGRCSACNGCRGFLCLGSSAVAISRDASRFLSDFT